MENDDVLAGRIAALEGVVGRAFDGAPEQVQGFILRVLSEFGLSGKSPLYAEPSLEACLQSARFGGYPALAKAGYCLARKSCQPFTESVAEGFLHFVAQQRERPVSTHAQLAGDALAVLGLADGLRAIAQSYPEIQFLEDSRDWLRGLTEQHGGSDLRLNRARLLASDLLDDQGRFGRQFTRGDDVRSAALDLCLWQRWSDVLPALEHPDTARRRDLFKKMLMEPLPGDGEVLHAASWLCALDVLTDDIAISAVPDSYQVARILSATQGSFRRWRWEERSTRKGVPPSRWLIDKEADVQAFLLAVLYPYFGDQLQDEQYLEGYGLRQGRFDFAIVSLRLIIEVKVLRVASDINGLEAQIADDLSLYFREGSPLESMIVYIYDDRDKPEAEKYPAIRDALKQRSQRIVDVVIVQRPSMIPDRKERQ